MSTTQPAAAVANDQAAKLEVRWLGRIEYAEALAVQESRLEAKLRGDAADHLLVLEHDPVYTLGRGADAADLRGAPERLGVPVHRVGRGGGATFHGPGQLVCYPIVRLTPSGRDVHRFVRALEATLVSTCARLGIDASVRSGQTGVWAGEAKIASIGIGVRRGISLHGTALNVATDLSFFDAIVPCRMEGLRTTSVEHLLGRAPSLEEVAAVFAACFVSELGYRPDRVEGFRPGPSGPFPAAAQH